MSQPADVAERTLVGNRWVLVGGVGYLLEWVAIIWVGALGIGETVVRGVSANELLDTYSGHVDALTTMAGWFSVVLLFRILLFIGLRQSLVDSGYRHPLAYAETLLVPAAVGRYTLHPHGPDRVRVVKALVR